MIGIAMATSVVAFAKGPKMKPEELVARHLEALGSVEARSSAQSRKAEGRGRMRVVLGGAGSLIGSASLVSEGEKVLWSMRLNRVHYSAERVSFDGKKVRVAHISPGKRSQLGIFLDQHQGLVHEGMLGGALSTAWPLLDLKARRPKLKYKGLKKVDDKQLLALEYRPRKSWGDVKTKLYFDPETFYHVLTIHRVTVRTSRSEQSLSGGSTGLGTPSASRRSRETARDYFTMEERFGDFHPKDGLNLPTRWAIRMRVQTDQGSFEGEWEMKDQQITHNLPEDPQRFERR